MILALLTSIMVMMVALEPSSLSTWNFMDGEVSPKVRCKASGPWEKG